MTPVEFVSKTEHYTFEECAGVDLKEVVTREGFQGIRLVPTRTPEGKPGKPLVGIQYVIPLVDDASRTNVVTDEAHSEA